MIGSERAAKQAERVAGIIRARGKTHGEADVQFVTLARLWGEFLGVELSAQQTMYMMLLAKVSRVAVGGIAAEHVEDIAGYAALVLGDMEKDNTSPPAEGDPPMTEKDRADIMARYERLLFPPDDTKVTAEGEPSLIDAARRASDVRQNRLIFPPDGVPYEPVGALGNLIQADRAAYLRRMLSAAENDFRAYTEAGDDHES